MQGPATLTSEAAGRLRTIVCVLLSRNEFVPERCNLAARRVLEDALRDELAGGCTLPEALARVTASIDMRGRFAFREAEDHRTRCTIRNMIHLKLLEIPANRCCH